MRALLLLDSSSTQRMLEEYFESRGFVVSISSDPSEALDLATREHHGLILIDRLTIGENLVPFFAELRSSSVAARSVAVVLTLTERPDDIHPLIAAGADDYIVLPEEPDQLPSRLLVIERRARMMSRLMLEEEIGQETEHDLHAVADASPVMLWVAGPDGHATFFNRRYLEHTGRTLAQELGLGWAESLHPEDYSRCLDIHFNALNRRQEFRVEYRLRQGDGEYCWVLSNGVPRHTQFGEFLGYIGSCVDITEQKQGERVLRSSEERLRLVVRNMPVLMVGFDERNRIVVWNKECERVTGYGAERVLGNPKIMNMIAPQHPERESLLERWARPVASYRDWEMEIFCDTGELRTVSWSNISQHMRVPGWASWAIGVDITERCRAAEEHRELQARIQKAQKYESLGVLAGGVAHDFNNLLVSMLGKANLARMALDEHDPAYALIEQVEDAAKIAADLTDQMLAYSGRGTFLSQPVDVARALGEMQHLLEAAVPKHIEVTFDFGDQVSMIEGDITQFRQVAMNLVTNAAEAIGAAAGSIRVSTGTIDADRAWLSESCTPDDPREGTYCFVRVEDDGCGMKPEVVARIFDPFFTTKLTGRGLGLAAVLGIVRGHDGALKVDTEPGRGTTITVLFPASESAVPAPVEIPEDVSGYRADATFLVVDDEESVRDVARRMLQEFGFHVLTADSGHRAVEEYRIHADTIDGVLLDLSMPKMGGEETLRELHRIRSDVPVILSSGYHERDVVGQLEGDQHAGFIQKPYTADDLIGKIRRVLRESGSPSGAAAPDEATNLQGPTETTEAR